jgi:hypothetical protein
MLRDQGAYFDREEADYILRLHAERCEECDKKDNPHLLLICDGCELMWHTHCISLHDVPDGDWFCEGCTKDGTAQTVKKEKAIADKEAELKKAMMGSIDEDVTAGVGHGSDEEIEEDDDVAELLKAEMEEGGGEGLPEYDIPQSESSSSEMDNDESSDEEDSYYKNDKKNEAGEEKLKRAYLRAQKATMMANINEREAKKCSWACRELKPEEEDDPSIQIYQEFPHAGYGPRTFYAVKDLGKHEGE